VAESRADEDVRLRDATPADRAATRWLTARAFSAGGGSEPGAGPGGGDPTGNAGGRAPTPPAPLEVVADSRGRVVATATATLRGQWFGGRPTQ
jgi:hypothetical protein